MSLADWYSLQWRNRNRMPPFPTGAPAGANVSNDATTNPPANNTDPNTTLSHLLPQNDALGNATVRDRKALEPLFGPNIGAVTSGPAWTAVVDKKLVGTVDELTPDVVGGWVEKSKNPLQPTTTLQALVNLKRPSIRLSPLTVVPPSIPPSVPSTPHSHSPSPYPSHNNNNNNSHHLHHSLEFTYDADAPKIGIHVHVYLPRHHPDAQSHYAYQPYGSGALTNTGTGPLSATTAAAAAAAASSHQTYVKLLLFEGVFEGGFGRRLRLEDGAVVELGRFEKVPGGYHGGLAPSEPTAAATPVVEHHQGNESLAVGGGAVQTPTPIVTITPVPAQNTLAPTTDASPAEHSTATASENRTRRRFTQAFRFRRTPAANRTIAGPALAVVDAQPEGAGPGDPTTPVVSAAGGGANAGAASAGPGAKTEEDGVKLTIKLVALDEQGTELAAPNEQVTYLHVVRVGPPPVSVKKVRVAATAATTTGEGQTGQGEGDVNANTEATVRKSGEGGEVKDGLGDTVAEGVHDAHQQEQEEEEEDTRPWVVKVVKREATIGPHTFHLHEIFGLTSSSSTAATSSSTGNPTSGESATPTPTHSYPPTAPAIAHEHEHGGEVDEDPQSECLLCLSSPREVVLLPCRHLVACKECALNMVEFGAGGNIVQTEDDGANAAGSAGGAGGTGNAAGANAGATTTTTGGATNPRRKRKAKGWFCPVCRQPYTSLLRITTAPPPLPDPTTPLAVSGAPSGGSTGKDSGAGASGNADGGADLAGDSTANTTNATNTNANTNANANTTAGGGGLLGNLTSGIPSIPRPAFLRSLTGGSNANPAGGTIALGDVESRAGLGRVGS